MTDPRRHPRATGYRGSGFPDRPVERHPGAAARLPPDDRPEHWRLRVIAFVFTAVWEVTRRAPEAVAFAAADLAGRLAHRVAGATRSRVRRNLGRVVPRGDLDPTVRAAFRSYARYWVEAFRAADLDPDDLHRRTTTDGFAHLDAALAQGKGAIVLLAHHGSWDIAAQWGETHGYHLAVVVEVLRPRRVFERFVRLREAVGLEVVPLAKGTRSAAQASTGGRDRGLFEHLERVLADNHIVGLLADRDLTGRAPVVSLFGEAARLPHGPAVLSRRTGAPILPFTMLQRPGRRWHGQVLPPLEVAGRPLEKAGAALAEGIEQLVALDPAQWHAFQPVWLADVPARRDGREAT